MNCTYYTSVVMASGCQFKSAISDAIYYTFSLCSWDNWYSTCKSPLIYYAIFNFRWHHIRHAKANTIIILLRISLTDTIENVLFRGTRSAWAEGARTKVSLPRVRDWLYLIANNLISQQIVKVYYWTLHLYSSYPTTRADGYIVLFWE